MERCGHIVFQARSKISRLDPLGFARRKQRHVIYSDQDGLISFKFVPSTPSITVDIKHLASDSSPSSSIHWEGYTTMRCGRSGIWRHGKSLATTSAVDGRQVGGTCVTISETALVGPGSPHWSVCDTGDMKPWACSGCFRIAHLASTRSTIKAIVVRTRLHEDM